MARLSIILFSIFSFLSLSSLTLCQTGTKTTGTENSETQLESATIKKSTGLSVSNSTGIDDNLKEKSKSESGGESYRVLKVCHCLNQSNIAGLNDAIVVKIKDFEKFWEKSVREGKKVLLYINEYVLSGIDPQQYGKDELKFDLLINDKNKSSWEKILTGNFQSTKKVAITVGLEGDTPLETNVRENEAFELFLVSQLAWYLFFAIMTVVLLLLIWGAFKTDLLREKGYPVPIGQKRVFSLGLAQMAFWLYIIFGAFLLLFLVMQQIPTLNTSVLILLGISSVTALSSYLINSSKIENEKNSKISLVAEVEMLTERINYIDKELKNNDLSKSDQMLLQQERDIKQLRLLELKKSVSSAKTKIQFPKSKSFFRDLIEDNGEANLYRVQILLWTLVLGGIFLYKVIKELSMPEYDATLLSLMGISSGTYIGFKIPEKISM